MTDNTFNKLFWLLTITLAVVMVWNVYNYRHSLPSVWSSTTTKKIIIEEMPNQSMSEKEQFLQLKKTKSWRTRRKLFM